MFSCEFFEISKNTFSTEHLLTTASVPWISSSKTLPYLTKLNQVCKEGTDLILGDKEQYTVKMNKKLNDLNEPKTY